MIFTMNPDGSDQRELTGGTSPHYSATGQQIVFAAHRDGDSEIFMIRANGTHRHRLTDNSVDDIDPAFSPSGGQIVFSRKLAGGYEIFTMRTDGTHQRQLTHDSNGRGTVGPVFSPDATRIVYAEPSWHSYRGFGLFHMRTDGTFQRRFGLGNNPDYSPYGGHIVADGKGTHGNDDIFKVEPNGTHYISLTLTPAVPDEYPAFSPNSRWIVWSKEGELFKMRSNGNRVRRLTGPTLGDYLPDWQPRPR
jgi:Tol biopolymer transport system component